MSFEQTRDVIDRARSFHRELGEFYQRIECVVERERVKMVLDYLGRHEQRMEANLAEFERSAAKSVLDAWFTFTPGPLIRDSLAKMQIKPDMLSSEAICMALRLDENLLQLYKGAAEAAPAEAVREAFLRLFEEGKKEREKIVLDVFEPE